MVAIFTLAMPIFVWFGWRRIRSAEELPFFTIRQRRIREGWRLILLGFGLGIFGLATRLFGQRAVLVVITPTPSDTPPPSATPLPTATLIPSVTLTPSITYTPTTTPTPSATPTPEIPEALTVLFRESVTPRAEAVFSRIEISRRLDTLNRAVAPEATFENPIDILYGAFTYDFLDDGVRWTALWFVGPDIVCSETKPWDGGTGGYGFTECLPTNGWVPGQYEVQMFLGRTWIVSERFTVQGPVAPSATP